MLHLCLKQGDNIKILHTHDKLHFFLLSSQGLKCGIGVHNDTGLSYIFAGSL